MYIGHINSFNNKQDNACVVSLISDILNCIKRIIPDITRVILQSEKAGLYQNYIVPFFHSHAQHINLTLCFLLHSQIERIW